MKRYRFPVRTAILGLSTILMAVCCVSCSDIMLSEIVKPRVLKPGVTSLRLQAAGDRSVLVSWEAPKGCIADSYRIVNETTEEIYTTAGTELSATIKVPYNNAIYKVSVSAQYGKSVSDSSYGYVSTTRHPTSSVYSDISMEQSESGPIEVTKRFYQEYEYDESGNEINILVYELDGTTKKLDSTCETTYDGIGRVLSYYQYFVDQGGKRVLFGYTFDVYYPEGGVKISFYGLDNKFDYYDITTVDSDGKTVGRTRYNPDGTVKRICTITFNENNTRNEYTWKNPDGSQSSKRVYYYADYGVLERIEHFYGTPDCYKKEFYMYSETTGDLVRLIFKELSSDGEWRIVYDEAISYD